MTGDRAGSDSEPAFVVPGDVLSGDVRLWIVRHGETEWSKNGKHTGVSDIPLTDDGREQAAALRDMFRDLHPTLVLSSPRSRALDTAELAGLHVDEVTDELAEWNYGGYEGITTDEIHRTVPDWTVWTHGCPNGESVAEVGARADALLRRVASRLADGPVVLVGHGHFSRALGARWIGLPTSGGAHLQLGTAAPSLLGSEHATPTLNHWNLPNPAADNNRAEEPRTP